MDFQKLKSETKQADTYSPSETKVTRRDKAAEPHGLSTSYKDGGDDYPILVNGTCVRSKLAPDQTCVIFTKYSRCDKP